MQRRQFLATSATAAVAAALAPALRADQRVPTNERYAPLDAAAAHPVLDTSAFSNPVILAAIEFLENGEHCFVRVRSRDGAEGLSVSNNRDLAVLVPMARQLIVPFLLGKDLRDWEALIEGVYLHSSNYKRQGLLFWVPFAAIEFAVLDLLGRIAGRPSAALLGGAPDTRVALYHAHDDRDESPEKSVENILVMRERHGTRAAKFKVGGRMRRNAEIVPGRSEALVELARARLGPDFTLYADANGSYDVATGIRLGRVCEAHGIAIFEEPVPHDQYDETKAVADALKIPVAGGEQESSHNRFRWMIAHRAIDVVQPDLFYFGGIIRSIRVARMAHAAGLECSPHLSGGGLGFLYMLHFISCIQNAGPFQEFKGFTNTLPVELPEAARSLVDGTLRSPARPGWGAEIAPSFLATARLLG